MKTTFNFFLQVGLRDLACPQVHLVRPVGKAQEEGNSRPGIHPEVDHRQTERQRSGGHFF